jgi:hypothetical protein
MEKVQLFCRATATAALCCLCCYGQNNGGVPVRVADFNAECINSSTDQVWLTLYRIIETKQKGFFTSENQAEVVVTVNVQSDPDPAKPLTFPLSKKVNVRAYSAGQVSLPVEYTLVSGLKLSQKSGTTNITYTGFNVDATLVNLKSKNGLGGALAALSTITGGNKLPIPSSPYTQAASYLLDFANQAITNDINDKNGDDKYSTASLSFNFDPQGKCGATGQGFETTGTKAILMADGEAGDGYVPIDQTGSYCWSADILPSFVLKASKNVPGKPCSDPSYAAASKPVTNNYLAFFLQKRTISGTLGSPTRIQTDKSNSKHLCDLLKIADCEAAR